MISLEQETSIIASYLPVGQIWAAKNIKGKNLRNLLTAFASITLLFRDHIELVKTELNIFTTTKLIDEYERLLGIPNACMPEVPKTLPERIRNVLIKLAGPRAKTLPELLAFLQLAFPEIEFINIVSPRERAGFPHKFPILLLEEGQRDNFIVIQLPQSLIINPFPLQFSIPFVLERVQLIECVINMLLPLDKYAIFEYVDTSRPYVPIPTEKMMDLMRLYRIEVRRAIEILSQIEFPIIESLRRNLLEKYQEEVRSTIAIITEIEFSKFAERKALLDRYKIDVAKVVEILELVEFAQAPARAKLLQEYKIEIANIVDILNNIEISKWPERRLLLEKLDDEVKAAINILNDIEFKDLLSLYKKELKAIIDTLIIIEN